MRDKALAEQIVRLVADMFDVSYSSVKGKKRQRLIAMAREVIAKSLRELDYTLMDIADVLNRDHSTIHYLIHKEPRLPHTENRLVYSEDGSGKVIHERRVYHISEVVDEVVRKFI